MANIEDEAIRIAYEYALVQARILESNKIEGIDAVTPGEVSEWQRFMELDEVNVDDLKRFVYVCAGAGHRLRTLITDHHQIGSRSLTGGPHVAQELNLLLYDIQTGAIDPWNAHVEYELLHPFTDGNGRSGRVLWHWMMKQEHGIYYDRMVAVGFLRRFYYQAMEFNSPLSR